MEEEGGAGALGHHAEAKKRLVRSEVGDGRGGVAPHNQLAGQVDKYERSRYDEQQVEPVCNLGLPIECVHGGALLLGFSRKPSSFSWGARAGVAQSGGA